MRLGEKSATETRRMQSYRHFWIARQMRRATHNAGESFMKLLRICDVCHRGLPPHLLAAGDRAISMLLGAAAMKS